MEEKISIIVPIYNAEEWLEKCIESIINQTYKNIEILLINDGSTDNSLKICEKFAKKDSRIIVIDKSNEGVSKTRNVGIEKSTGNYIKFVDSDDWIEENICEELLKLIKEEKTDLAICGLNIYKHNQILRTPHLKKKIVEIKKGIEEFKYINKVFASPCNKLYKKEKIKELFKIDLDSGEDLLFNLEYLKNIDKISITEKCLYNVCLDNETSLNRKFKKNKLDINLDLLDKQMEFCSNLYGKQAENNFLYNSYVLLLHAFLLQIQKMLDKNETKEIIKKYVYDKRIEKACEYIKFDRLDYKIFNKLVKNKRIIMIYYFIKFKNKFYT